MSTATPTNQDREALSALVAAFEAGQADRRDYWRAARYTLQELHPTYSGHDVTRVARILAPFPLQDGRYSPR